MQVMSAGASVLLTYCSLKLAQYRLHQKGYASFIALLITFFFFFFAWRLSKELILFFWMAEGSQANPMEQLLPCCTAPTTIQIGS